MYEIIGRIQGWAAETSSSLRYTIQTRVQRALQFPGCMHSSSNISDDHQRDPKYYESKWIECSLQNFEKFSIGRVTVMCEDSHGTDPGSRLWIAQWPAQCLGASNRKTTETSNENRETSQRPPEISGFRMEIVEIRYKCINLNVLLKCIT